MTERIHIVLDRVEKERFRRLAEREGKSLSEWLRDVASARADGDAALDRLDTPEQLDRFFGACDDQETGVEPEWEDHLKVIRGSIREGSSET
ncbi:MAG: hypothetical protein EXR95_05010 [Gemmatimonadetes bacterium]|nr:hypothetical protein [Gemmatimonadota bacterium]